ncbi:MAG: DUF779 domain-containing protein [Burkholderiales bacterium]|jgi:uncharacterized protein (DUF779 family)|nr:DUF779 domain-containing protein [Burkholderiales bacterium]
MVAKVVATPTALAFIETLKAKYGSNMIFHQSGGCCDNSAANLYMEGEVMVFNDVKLGELGGIPFYISASQYEYWKHTQIIIDVVEGGHGGTFSIEASEGKAFMADSRLFTDEEWAELVKAEPALAD